MIVAVFFATQPTITGVGVGSVAILVNDAKKSARWYRDKLGFEIVGIEGHTVFVRPKGSRAILLHLCAKCDAWENDRPGGRTGIWLQCGKIKIRKDEKTGQVLPASRSDDVERTYQELKKKRCEVLRGTYHRQLGQVRNPERP